MALVTKYEDILKLKDWQTLMFLMMYYAKIFQQEKVGNLKNLLLLQFFQVENRLLI